MLSLLLTLACTDDPLTSDSGSDSDTTPPEPWCDTHDGDEFAVRHAGR